MLIDRYFGWRPSTKIASILTWLVNKQGSIEAGDLDLTSFKCKEKMLVIFYSYRIKILKSIVDEVGMYFIKVCINFEINTEEKPFTGKLILSNVYLSTQRNLPKTI